MVDYLLGKGADPRILDLTGWDFMWEVESRLNSISAEDRPPLEALKNRLIDKYKMAYPAVQNKEEGNKIRINEKKKKGCYYNADGKLVIPEREAMYDELSVK